MDTDKLEILIDIALTELELYANRYFEGDNRVIEHTRRALQLLKKEAINNPNVINTRVLRAMHDVGGIVAKSHEETPLGNAIGDVYDMLYYETHNFSALKALGMDFGKGDPI